MSYRLTEGNRKNFAAIEDTKLELVKSTDVPGQVVWQYTDNDKLAISGLMPNYQLGKNKAVASVMLTDPIFNIRTEVKDVGWDFEVSGHLGEHGYLDTIQLHRLNDLSGAGTVNPKQIESLDTYRLGVTGDTVLSGSLTVSGLSTQVTSKIINLTGTLTQTGEAEFVDEVTLDKSLLVKTTTTLSGKVTALSGLEVTGISKFNSDIDATGQNISGLSLTLTETADVKTILANSGEIEILQVLHSGNITNLTATDAKISGLLVSGTSTFNGKVTVSGGLEVSGNATFKNDQYVGGNVSISGNTITSGNSYVSGNINISGNVIIAKDISGKSLVLNENLLVKNTITASSGYISGIISTSGRIDSIISKDVATSGLFANSGKVISGGIDYLNSTDINTTTFKSDSGTLTNLNSTSGNITTLWGTTVNAEYGNLNVISGTTGYIDNISGTTLQVEDVTAKNVSASSGLIDYIVTNTINNHGITHRRGNLVSEADLHRLHRLISNEVTQQLYQVVDEILFIPPDPILNLVTPEEDELIAIVDPATNSPTPTNSITFSWTNPHSADIEAVYIQILVAGIQVRDELVPCKRDEEVTYTIENLEQEVTYGFILSTKDVLGGKLTPTDAGSFTIKDTTPPLVPEISDADTKQESNEPGSSYIAIKCDYDAAHSATDIDTIIIYRAESEDEDYVPEDSDFVEIGDVDSEFYHDHTIEDNKFYTYKIIATDIYNNSSESTSNAIASRIKPEPVSLTHPVLNDVNRTFRINWILPADEDIDKIEISWAKKDGIYTTPLALSSDQVAYLHEHLENFETYSYKIEVVDKTGLVSAPVTLVQNTEFGPLEVKSITVTSIPGTITLTWVLPDDPDIHHVSIKRYFNADNSEDNSFPGFVLLLEDDDYKSSLIDTYNIDNVEYYYTVATCYITGDDKITSTKNNPVQGYIIPYYELKFTSDDSHYLSTNVQDGPVQTGQVRSIEVSFESGYTLSDVSRAFINQLPDVDILLDEDSQFNYSFTMPDRDLTINYTTQAV